MDDPPAEERGAGPAVNGTTRFKQDAGSSAFFGLGWGWFVIVVLDGTAPHHGNNAVGCGSAFMPSRSQ